MSFTYECTLQWRVGDDVLQTVRHKVKLHEASVSKAYARALSREWNSKRGQQLRVMPGVKLGMWRKLAAA